MIVPPLTVCLLTGPEMDTIISCFLFLCGVIPSHIHGFYLSCTYFHRRRKARKGRYPGPPCTFIYDRRVWNGGLSDTEVEYRRTNELRKKQRRYDEKDRVVRRSSMKRHTPASVQGSGPPLVNEGNYVPPNVMYPGAPGITHTGRGPGGRHSRIPANPGSMYRR